MNQPSRRSITGRIVAVLVLYFSMVGGRLHAQGAFQTRHRFEAHVAVAAQRPYYANSTKLSGFIFKEYRYRVAGEVGVRYYVFKKWYAEYQLAYSPEGGGLAEQHTNANYLKNSLLLGFSARHSRRIIFNIYTGINTNLLLGARFHALNGTVEQVKDYYRSTYFGIPLGLGLKTKVGEVGYVALGTFISMSRSSVSRNDNISSIQVVSPAFKLTFSKFL